MGRPRRDSWKWPPADGTTVPVTLGGAEVGVATFRQGDLQVRFTDSQTAKFVAERGGGISVGHDADGSVLSAEVVPWPAKAAEAP